MLQTFSRRLFLAVSGGAMVTPSALWAAGEAPVALDHILLGISDLERGIAFMEERTGVRAMFGGVHPGVGTRNALLSLGSQSYLEIFATDPKQAAPKRHPEIVEMKEPRLLGWAAHTEDIATLARKIADSGVATVGPYDGSRVRPDGKTLRWKRLPLADDRGGLLPFFIEWSRDSVHPSVDAPSGCKLLKFIAQSPDPAELTQTYRRLGVDMSVERGDRVQLLARIAGPKGEVELTS